ncbi:PAS domain S-box protein [Pantanalinema sp. GBBB05]|uniref:sensor histidine kinase n=1 Tax=Pantanalinema sp. GBBB05 TaxID=2604139 RepID=UPI001D2AC137|nr:PAS domain S-box protein [Pantanalinema sp. GBBB05]
MTSQPQFLSVNLPIPLVTNSDASEQQELIRLRQENEQLRRELATYQQHQLEWQQLESARFRLAAIVDSSNDAIISKTLDGIIVSWNASAERIYGYQAEEILGKHITLLIPDNRLDEEPKIIERLKRGECIDHFETVRKRKDGTLIDISLTISPVKDREGNIIGASKIARDISAQQAILRDRQHAEAKLQQRTQDLEQALQELKRTQMQMIQAEKLSGLGQLVAGVAHEINNPVNFIYGNLTHTNDYIQDLLRLLHLYQQHYPTPHPDIQQATDTIELEFLTEDLQKLLRSMQVGVHRIQGIVASLRNFSRMDEAEMKEVNIHDGIDSTLVILQHRLKAKPNSPQIDVIKHYGKLPLVECYTGQLNQVFMNILCNAIDALEDGFQPSNSQTELQPAPVITIRTELLHHDRVRIAISDNGRGIPEHVKKHLFNPFFTTKPIGKGTGLGMSISYEIIHKKHHGSLTCLSALGQGTEFVIEIPIHQTL